MGEKGGSILATTNNEIIEVLKTNNYDYEKIKAFKGLSWKTWYLKLLLKVKFWRLG